MDFSFKGAHNKFSLMLITQKYTIYKSAFKNILSDFYIAFSQLIGTYVKWIWQSINESTDFVKFWQTGDSKDN